MRQVLYRMYRPQNFDEIYGQDHIIPILKNQIKTGNISHAYLFAGPRGTGKTSTARIFAKELNNGSEMDIIELDAASHNKVEDIREIMDKLSLAPFESKYKIYILDEVHMLTGSASNAFLKSLEEPPSHVVFIMATTEPHKLPPTILSRTQRFDFSKITLDAITKRLKVVLAEEKITFSEDAVEFIAKKSDGGLRDALSLLDKAISYGELDMENVTKALGSVRSTYKSDILTYMVQKNFSKVLEVLDDVQSSGLDPKVMVSDLIEFLRDIILYQNGVDVENEYVAEISKIISDEIASYIIEELSKTISYIRFSPNPNAQIIADMVVLSNANFENIATYRQLPSILKNELSAQKLQINSLLQKIEFLEQKLENLHTYPQNPVDNNGISVDKDNNPSKTNNHNSEKLSPHYNLDEFYPANVSDIKHTKIDEEEQKKLSELEVFLPELKVRLKKLKKINIFTLLSMARMARYVNGNLFFVFEEDNRNMLDMMLATHPNEFVDPIFSELAGVKIVTHYIGDDELQNFKKDDWENLVEDIKEHFPDVEIEIE